MISIDPHSLAAMDAYIEQNMSNHLLSIPMLATTFFMSESTLLRRIKFLTGQTPQQYLQELRLQKAFQLLKEGGYQTVAEVAQEVGFSNARSFTRSFKRRFGMIPSEARNLN